MLIGIMVLVALVVCAIVYFVIPILNGGTLGISLFWQVPVTFVGVMLFTLFVFCVIAIIGALTVKRDQVYETTPKWARTILLMVVQFVLNVSNVLIETEGMDKVPETPVLFVSNHRSNFDPLSSIWAIRMRDAIFVSKRENLDMPVIGQYIVRNGYLEIDREDPRKAMKTLMYCADCIKTRARDIFIYPEGTRNKDFDVEKLDETGLLEFHNGVMKIAQMAKCPIVPVTVMGTEKVGKWFPFRFHRVKIVFDAPIPVEEVMGHKTTEIAEKVRNTMLEQMKKNHK